MGYDIGCSFETTVRNSSLGPEFERKQCRTCVNAFHGYSHNSTCQQKYHPLSIRGTGLEDLETLERFFSSSNQLASITRYMSSYRRRVFIDMFLQQWDREKYHNLATMLHNNYIQALNILQNEEPAYRADLATLGLTEEDLDAYQTSEFEHLKSLGTEHEGDVFAAAYVELLQDYRKARYLLCLTYNISSVLTTVNELIVLHMTMQLMASASKRQLTIISFLLPLNTIQASPRVGKQKLNVDFFGKGGTSCFLRLFKWKLRWVSVAGGRLQTVNILKVWNSSAPENTVKPLNIFTSSLCSGFSSYIR